jgi:hypothetical protein
MLRLVIGDDGFNEETQEFTTINEVVVDLEHSLLSLSKWESKYQKPFLSSKERTREETFGYLQAMIVSPDVDPDVLYKCSQKHLNMIQAYIDSPESATTFMTMSGRQGPGEIITAELIYYWLVAFSIPFEVETWHLNRLFSLIRICGIKNSPPEEQQMSRRQMMEERHRLNEQRKKELGTTG